MASPPSLTGFAYFNNASNGFQSGTTPSFSVNNGDLLLAIVEVDGVTTPPAGTTVTDSQGNTYSLLTTLLYSNAAIFVYGATASATGSITTTVSFAATEPAQFIASAWSNAATTISNTAVGTAATSATASITTTAASTAVVAIALYARPSSSTVNLTLTPTAGTGFQTSGASPGFSLNSQYVEPSSSGSVVSAAANDNAGTVAQIGLFQIDNAGGGRVTPTVYGHATVQASSANSAVFKPFPAPAGGSVYLYVYSTGYSVTNVIDSQGNAYRLLRQVQNGPFLSLWVADGISGSPNLTVTVLLNGMAGSVSGVAVSLAGTAYPSQDFVGPGSTGNSTTGSDPLAATTSGALVLFGIGEAPGQTPTPTGALVPLDQLPNLQDFTETAPGGPTTPTVTFPVNAEWAAIAVSVLGAFAPPLSVSASGSPSSGIAPLNVAFMAAASGGSPPYSYSWTFGDGGTSAQQNPTHTYGGPGTYTAKVTVTDSVPNTASATVTTQVGTPPPPPPPPPPNPSPFAPPDPRLLYPALIQQPCVGFAPAQILTYPPPAGAPFTLREGDPAANLPGVYYDRCALEYVSAGGNLLGNLPPAVVPSI